jgi:hypothetical protein
MKPHRADARVSACSWAMCLQALLDRTDEPAQRHALQSSVTFKEAEHWLRHRAHPPAEGRRRRHADL